MSTIYISNDSRNAIAAVNDVLQVIFKDNPENVTCLRKFFFPNKIQVRWGDPKGDCPYVKKIKMWGPGLYVDVMIEGWESNELSPTTISFKSQRIGGGWFRFQTQTVALLLQNVEKLQAIHLLLK